MRIWVFLYRLILFLFQSMIPSSLENPTIIPSYQISSWDHFDPISYLSKQYLDQDHFHLDLSHIVPTYSNYKCVIWVKCDTSNHRFYSCYPCSVDQINIIAPIQYSMYPIETLNHNLKCYLPLLNPLPTWSWFHV
jgi:hypothetical protein